MTGILNIPLVARDGFKPTPGRPTAAPAHFPYDHDSLAIADRRAQIAVKRA